MGGRGSKSGLMGSIDRDATAGGEIDEDSLATKDSLAQRSITYNPVKKLGKALSEEEIIEKVGGYDKTGGSCTSLAFAYIANENGYDVVDFKGGVSQDYFAKRETIDKIIALSGVESYSSYNTDDFEGVSKVLKNVKKGNTYILTAGGHTAVVRKTEKGKIQYLELQKYKYSPNGFKSLTPTALEERFKCYHSNSRHGVAKSVETILIEGKSLMQNGEFMELLGYLNTSKGESSEKKQAK